MPARWAYVDTSVLVKRYIKEEGSPGARNLLRRYRFLSSAITPLEALSALSRRRTVGDLSERDFLAIRARMQRDRTYWELVELSPLVLSRAEELIQKTRLRTLDAVHVASAMIFQTASGLTIPVITADAQQRVAAEDLALTVIWVG